MSKLKRIHLFSRLNPTAYKAMESATVLCKTRGNPYVELVHLVNQIIMSENTVNVNVEVPTEIDTSVSKHNIPYVLEQIEKLHILLTLAVIRR